MPGNMALPRKVGWAFGGIPSGAWALGGLHLCGLQSKRAALWGSQVWGRRVGAALRGPLPRELERTGRRGGHRQSAGE